MMLLVIKDLTKTYSRQQKTFEAVSHVGFSLQKGEMAVITGPSVCGKSTLFHLICGITHPDQGSIQLEKQELVGLSNKELAKVRAQKISYILQGNSLLPNFTVLENICLPHQLGGWQENLKEKAMELLKEFGLENMAPITFRAASAGASLSQGLSSTTRFWWWPMSRPATSMSRTPRLSLTTSNASSRRVRPS